MKIKQSDGRFHHAGAICHFPFVYTLVSGQPPYCLRCYTNPCRACPYATNIPVGEPNTPLAFRQWDACHSKQQAGHVKTVVGSGQDTENPILWCSRLYFGSALIVSTEKSVRAFNQVVLSKNCCFRSESASKIPLRYLNRKSSSKHTQLFGRTLYISKPYLLYMMLIFVSPIFGIGLPCL